MATTADLERWFSTAVGRGMNPDKTYGFQCKDVIDDMCLALWGSWVNTITPGNANQVYATSNGNYFEKLPANVALKRGDVVCWKEVLGNTFGHIAVVETPGSTYRVIEQNGFTNTRPAYIASYSTRNNVMGVLRPKLANVAPQEAPVAKTSKDDTELMFQVFLGRTAAPSFEWAGQEFDVAFRGISGSPEAQAYRQSVNERLAKADQVDGLAKQIQSQQIQIDELTKQLKEALNKVPDTVPVTVQVPVGIDEMSLGQLLTVAFSKLFKIK